MTTSPTFSIYAARQHRHQRIGDAVLSVLEQRARALGYHKMVLAALASNLPGTRLYERHGIQTVGIYREHGKLDGQWVDVIIMEKSSRNAWSDDSAL